MSGVASCPCSSACERFHAVPFLRVLSVCWMHASPSQSIFAQILALNFLICRSLYSNNAFAGSILGMLYILTHFFFTTYESSAFTDRETEAEWPVKPTVSRTLNHTPLQVGMLRPHLSLHNLGQPGRDSETGASRFTGHSEKHQTTRGSAEGLPSPGPPCAECQPGSRAVGEGHSGVRTQAPVRGPRTPELPAG